MGACASVPKAMRGEITAPPPEPPKEDTTTTVAPEVTTVEDKEKENVAADQSLGTLLVEDEGAKEESTSESTKVDNEESKAEELPVSEPATSVLEPPPAEKKAEAAPPEEKKAEAVDKK